MHTKEQSTSTLVNAEVHLISLHRYMTHQYFYSTTKEINKRNDCNEDTAKAKGHDDHLILA